jgi:glycosyltransferase involved in cell wall biosynthesis
VSHPPGVSVVIPTRNRSALVEEAVRSALVQEWDPLEVVVVDDASTDDTVSRLAGVIDPRLRVLKRPSRGGPSAARNDGIRAARFPYVAFLDSDNTFALEKLAIQMTRFLDEGGQGVSFTGYTLDLNGGLSDVLLDQWSPAPAAVLQRLLDSCCVNTSTVLVRRDVLLQSGSFQPDLACCEDHELWLRLALDGQSFSYVSCPLTQYRMHPGSVSADEGLVARTSESVIAAALNSPGLPSQLRRRRSAYEARWALSSAGRFLLIGDRRSAFAALARAVRTDPRSVRPGWFLLAMRIAAGSRRAVRS